MALDRVVHLGRPLALAVAALVERDAVPLAAQREADQVPGMGVEPAAVQEDHGRQAGRPPVEVVKAHALRASEVVLVGQHDLGQGDAGGGGGQLEVRAELVGSEGHRVSSRKRSSDGLHRPNLLRQAGRVNTSRRARLAA